MEQARRKVLITGGSGLLGRALLSTAGAEYRLTMLHRQNYPVPHERATQVVLDVLDQKRLAELFDANQFDVVIHAAGIASVDYVERHYEEARDSNVTGTRNVVDLVYKYGSRLVHVSSNAVFDGRHAPYRESDPTNPVNKYGQIKVECEHLVSRQCPQAAIVRPILMYGWPFPEGRPNPATWIIESLRQGEHVHVVTDVQENPLWSHHCAEAIWRIIDREVSGAIHLAGKDSVNRYEFARLVARVFELDASLIHPVTSSFFPTIAPRPHNTSFVTERMEQELGLKPLSLDDGLRRMRASGGASTVSRLTSIA